MNTEKIDLDAILTLTGAAIKSKTHNRDSFYVFQKAGLYWLGHSRSKLNRQSSNYNHFTKKQ